MKSLKRIIAFFAALSLPLCAFADGGTTTDFSPYSKFGFGIPNRSGNAFSRTMGGVGTATRDNKYMNILNPAAVTARDTLSFMLDFSIAQSNDFFSQDSRKSVNNTFNISNFALSFPIWRSSAIMLGICPFSSVGYEFTDKLNDKEVIGHTGNVTDVFAGTGSLYKVYIAGGATFWDRFSVGAQFDFLFGNIEKYSTRTFESNYRSIYNGDEMSIRAFTGEFGVQYEQPFGKHRMVFGATYRLKTGLNGNATNMCFSTQSSVTDTLRNEVIDLRKVNIPDEFSIGVSYRYADKWRAEFNYSRSDWRNSNFENARGFSSEGFTTAVSNNFKAGFEYVPNRSDIRYYMRRVAYRAGFYYTGEYFKYAGNRVNTIGLTLGMTLPVYRWHNGITVGVELGQRYGTLPSMLKERFVNVNFSLNMFDVWFIKHKYE